MNVPVVLSLVSFLLGSSIFRPATASSNYTREKGYCMWYGECAISKFTRKPLNCFYNGKAKNITNEKSRDILYKICPELVERDRGVCCDYKQVVSLEKGLQSAKQMMARCPACWKNFRQLYCQMTCGPDNSLYINPTSFVSDFNKTAIYSIEYYVDHSFRDGLYNSCKDVIFPSSNQKIMNFLCGRPADKCSPMLFLQFMGDPRKNGRQSPFLITYPANSSGHPHIKAMNVSIRLCNETVYEPYTNSTHDKCSCQDCLISCKPLPPYIPPKKWELDIVDVHFNISSFLTLLLCLAFFVIFIAGCILHFNLSSKRQQFGFKSHHGYPMVKDYQQTKDSLSTLARTCNYPLLVVICSIIFVVVCGVGLIKFTVVTDPVKLWSSPDSEARKEKDIYDSNFSPFYRTAQIIFTVKPGSNYSKNSCYQPALDNYCLLTGPILRKQFLFKVLDVQNHLTKMSVEFHDSTKNSSHITLEDICVKPLSPYNNNCTIMSPLQYWQNDAKKLNVCIGIISPDCSFNDVNVSWGDHLIACANNPTATDDDTYLHQSCRSLFGDPVAPNIAFGGYKGGEYSDASALVVSFIIKNHLDDSKNDKAKAWEKQFLEYMRNYSDHDLDIAYRILSN